MKTKQKFSMTEGSIVKAMIAFTVPLMIGQFFQEMYNTTNALIVGIFLGSEELAAVTSTGSLINLFIGFFNGTSVGAGVIIATFYAAKNYKNLKEGEMTKVRATVVCEESLYKVAIRHNFSDFLNLGKSESSNQENLSKAILADSVEAVIAAIYLDSNLENAETFIINNLQQAIEIASRNVGNKDYKTVLQEKLQINGEVLIQYEIGRVPH